MHLGKFEKSINMNISNILADLISASYKKSPRLTIAVIIFTITIIVASASTVEYLREQDFKKNAPSDLLTQIEELNKLDSGLNKLTAFIQQQKEQLSEKQSIITELEKKRSELEPIVNSQAEIVDAIFKIQEQRSQRNKWFDLGIGFGLGIIGSLIASVIYKLAEHRRKSA
jgi:uncharacterized membrane protein YraQ (UPF0718 family)